MTFASEAYLPKDAGIDDAVTRLGASFSGRGGRQAGSFQVSPNASPNAKDCPSGIPFRAIVLDGQWSELGADVAGVFLRANSSSGIDATRRSSVLGRACS
jgi:hypothetical protein